MANEIKYTIEITSKKTGLTKNTIRAWEQRYNFLHPERTNTKRRIYSEQEVEKLSLLANATKSGYKIGNIYYYSLEELRKIVLETDKTEHIEKYKHFEIQNAIKYIKNFDETNLRLILESAFIENSKPVFIKKILLPLIEMIGDLWKNGELRVAHEHFATSIIISLIYRMYDSNSNEINTKTAVVCTPRGQRHEIGALISSMILNSQGWKTIYLNSDLPAEEIAYTVNFTKSSIVVLSVIFPLNEIQILNEVKKIRDFVKNIPIILGSNKLQLNQFNDFENVFLIDDFEKLNDLNF